MVVTHVPFREPLGDKKKDSRKQVWKDGSQMMWAVTPDPMKGKAWSWAGGAHSHSASTLVGQIYLPLRSEASLAETKNQLSKGPEHKGSTYTESQSLTWEQEPGLVTWKLMGDSLRKAKMEAGKSLTPGSKIIS